MRLKHIETSNAWESVVDPLLKSNPDVYWSNSFRFRPLNYEANEVKEVLLILRFQTPELPYGCKERGTEWGLNSIEIKKSAFPHSRNEDSTSSHISANSSQLGRPRECMGGAVETSVLSSLLNHPTSEGICSDLKWYEMVLYDLFYIGSLMSISTTHPQTILKWQCTFLPADIWISVLFLYNAVVAQSFVPSHCCPSCWTR